MAMRSRPVGLRRLASNAGPTLVAVALLGVALGTAAAAFSILHATVLNPLPFAAQDELAMIWQSDLQRDLPVSEIAYRNYVDLRERTRTFADVTAFGSVNWNLDLIEPGPSARIPLAVVTGSFFSVLQVPPLLGRALQASDDTPGAPVALVLSHSVWIQRFGGDPTIVGRAVRVGSDRGPRTGTIVGVMPREFDFPRGAHVWMALAPYAMGLDKDGTKQVLENRWFGVLYALGRLRPGMTAEDGRRELAELIPQVHPNGLGHPTVVVTPLVHYLLGPSRAAMWSIFALALLVWLLASANVAGLLLVQSSARRRELAVQRTLGASSWRLASSWLLQACAVTAGAGVLAFAVAEGGRRIAIALAGSNVPRLEDATLGTPVLAFGLGISAVAVLLAGALPALFAARATPIDLLRQSARGRRSRMQRWLVLAELTIAIVALAVTARLVRAVLDLDTLAFGFHPQGVLNAQVLPNTKDWTRWNAFYDEFLARVRTLPGVDAAGAVSLRPLRYEAIGTDTNVALAGQSLRYESWKDNPIVNLQTVTPGYFEAMGIPTLRGRVFTQEDQESTPGVVVVGERAAARLWPGIDPIGQRVAAGTYRAVDAKGQHLWQTVIGVVQDVHYRSLNDVRLDLYMPATQSPLDRVYYAMIHTSGDPVRLVDPITRIAHSIDAGAALSDVAAMPQIVYEATRVWRLTRTIAMAFGVLAIVIAGIGLYALLAQAVLARRYELAVRAALGARPAQLSQLVLREACLLAAAATAAGLILATPATRLLASLEVHGGRIDPLGLAGVIVVLFAVGGAASLLPAVRAARSAPAAVLRSE
jgi:putative ABC transport system permease protein